MSVKQNVFKLNVVYDLVRSGDIAYSGSPDEPGTLWTWGANYYGILGVGDIISHRSSPIQVPGTQWVSGSLGEQNAVSRKSDGTLWTWGANFQGGIGDNTIIHKSSPVQVPGTQWIDAIAGANNSVIALKSDNTLWVWGYNDNGRLGDGTTIHRSSPVQIPGTQWCKVGMGMGVTHAIKTDGTLWGWGYNSWRSFIGDNTTILRSSPVQIPGTQWTDVSVRGCNTFARKTDGTIWSWGYNARGILGPNGGANYTKVSSPIQIPGTQWTDISGGTVHAMAKKSDGTLWVWGSSQLGTLGNGTIGSSPYCNPSPIQLPGTAWNDIAASDNSSFATKTDGTLWAWGYNDRGQLGINVTSIYTLSPQQIPGTQWLSVGCSEGFNGIARKGI